MAIDEVGNYCNIVKNGSQWEYARVPSCAESRASSVNLPTYSGLTSAPKIFLEYLFFLLPAGQGYKLNDIQECSAQQDTSNAVPKVPTTSPKEHAHEKEYKTVSRSQRGQRSLAVNLRALCNIECESKTTFTKS
ncbi:hypothetical protein CBL_07091 [Carabus blaptoides fortunei]